MAWNLCLGTFVLVLAMLHIPINCDDPPNALQEKMSPGLNTLFSTDESATQDIVLEFAEQPSTVIDQFEMANFGLMSENAQVNLHRNVINGMKGLRDGSQKKVLEVLKREAPNSFQSYWISNSIFIKGASKKLAEKLASFENVESVSEEQVFHIHHPIDGGEIVDESKEIKVQAGINEVQWNINSIGAPALWAQGITGDGCTIGMIDTGISSGHEAFKGTIIKKWHDAVLSKTEPYDDNGHGTHVCGTMVGKNGIGGAPDASLIVCKACDKNGACKAEHLTNCSQFMAEQRPHCVSNSWGGPSDSGKKSQYTDAVLAWSKFNIFSVFSAGNSGPDCGTVGSPADYNNVMAVGATDKNKKVADFSSRGRCKNKEPCPSVCAPGHKIQSAWIGGSTKYNTISGTSMAAPSVTAMYALMKSANPQLTTAQAKDAIEGSCQHSGLPDTKQTCGGKSVNDHPNNIYGFGNIDCVQGMKLAATFTQRNKLELLKQELSEE